MREHRLERRAERRRRRARPEREERFTPLLEERAERAPLLGGEPRRIVGDDADEALEVHGAIGHRRDGAEREVEPERRERLLDDRRAAGGGRLVGRVGDDRDRGGRRLGDDGGDVVHGDRVRAVEPRDEVGGGVARGSRSSRRPPAPGGAAAAAEDLLARTERHFAPRRRRPVPAGDVTRT